MSVGRHQEPEHLVIIGYVRGLLRDRVFSLVELGDALAPVYNDMIPQDGSAPLFDLIHRHDSIREYERKDKANRKRLERIFNQESFFPLGMRNPLIYALNEIKPGMGVELHKRLVRNQGLVYMPLDIGDGGDVLYAEFVTSFAAANAAVVRDIQHDQLLDDPATRHRLLELFESCAGMLRALDGNISKGVE